MLNVEGESPIRLVCGLGNPGGEYEGTRHNVGFMVVDALAASLRRVEPELSRWSGRCRAAAFVGGRRLWLLKPTTYMNLSGESVLAAVRSEKLMSAELIVVYDDLDLPFGRIRLRRGGGAGGHRGVESIIAALGDDRFARLRIGIGRAAERGGEVDHVLESFSEGERPILEETIKLAVKALDLTLRRGVGFAMNACNGLPTTAESLPKPIKEV